MKVNGEVIMKRVIFIIVIVGSFFMIQSLIRSIYGLWQKQDLLTRAETELKREKKENEELKRKLIHTQSEGFIEEQARNKLFLQKPGESKVIVDERLLRAVSGSQSATKKPQKPNWQAWWELFF